MAIGYVDAGVNNAQSTAVSVSLTIPEGWAKCLIVGVCVYSTDRTVDYVRWGGSGGTDLTQIATLSGNSTQVDLWGLMNPTSQASTVYAHCTSSEHMVVGAVCFVGVKNWSNSATNSGKNSNPSINVTTISGCWVIDCVSVKEDVYSFTVGAGQTERYQQQRTSQDFRGFGSTEIATSTSTTMSWSSSSTDAIWAQAAVRLNPQERSYGYIIRPM